MPLKYNPVCFVHGSLSDAHPILNLGYVPSQLVHILCLGTWAAVGALGNSWDNMGSGVN